MGFNMLLAILWSALVATAAPISIGPAPPVPTIGLDAESSVRFEVLDINLKSGVIAYKELATTSEELGSVNCNYAGMESSPFTGVVLGVWNVSESKPGKSFVVYSIATDETSCMPHSESEKQLNEAKAHFSSLGLDITKKPASLPIIKDSFEVDAVKVAMQTRRLSDSESFKRGYLSTNPDKEPIWSAVTFFGLTLDEELAYEIYKLHGVQGAERLQFSLAGAWVDSGKLIVAIGHKSVHMRGANQSYSFSPLIEIPQK
jgi:hypothetical protein